MVKQRSNFLSFRHSDFFFLPGEKKEGDSEILNINLGRLVYLLYLGLPVTLSHIALFTWNLGASTGVERVWRLNLIFSHSLLSVLFLVIGTFAVVVKNNRKKYPEFSVAIPHFLYLIILVMGAVIAGFDQLITNAITPYLIVSLLSAIILIMSPFWSAVYFLVSFVTLVVFINIYQIDDDVILSNLVNGLTAMAIGWFLSITLWRNHLLRFRKDHIIAQQQSRLEEQNARLQQVADELSRVNATKDKLFSIVSHDLKSPLANLEGLLKYYRSGDLSHQEFNTMLPALYNQVFLTGELLENLLNWSRSNLRGAVLKKEKFNLSVVTSGILKLYSHSIREKQLEIIQKLPPQLNIYADKGMISLVMRNLISNAVKFSTPGGSIIIGHTLTGSLAEISVMDTGVGIPPERLASVFTDINYTTQGTSGEKGSGLGLMLCREFVEANGGSIFAESPQGSGSTFRFTVPAV